MRKILIISVIIIIFAAIGAFAWGYGKGKTHGIESTWTDAYNSAVSAAKSCDMKHRSLTPRWSVCDRKYFDENSYTQNNCVNLTLYCNGDFAP